MNGREGVASAAINRSPGRAAQAPAGAVYDRQSLGRGKPAVTRPGRSVGTTVSHGVL